MPTSVAIALQRSMDQNVRISGGLRAYPSDGAQVRYAPPDQRRHIETADADSLLAWSENILTAERPEDVLR